MTKEQIQTFCQLTFESFTWSDSSDVLDVDEYLIIVSGLNPDVLYAQTLVNVAKAVEELAVKSESITFLAIIEKREVKLEFGNSI